MGMGYVGKNPCNICTETQDGMGHVVFPGNELCFCSFFSHKVDLDLYKIFTSSSG
jgi:hypothetical protein